MGGLKPSLRATMASAANTSPLMDTSAPGVWDRKWWWEWGVK